MESAPDGAPAMTPAVTPNAASPDDARVEVHSTPIAPDHGPPPVGGAEDMDLIAFGSPRPAPQPPATSQDLLVDPVEATPASAPGASLADEPPAADPPDAASLLGDARANPPDLLGGMPAHVEAAPAPVDDKDFLSDVPVPTPPPLSSGDGSPTSGGLLQPLAADPPEFFDVASFCGAPPPPAVDKTRIDDLQPSAEFATPTDPTPMPTPPAREVMEPFSELDEADLQVAMESVPAIATGLRDAVSVLSTNIPPSFPEDPLPEVPSDLEVPGEPPTMAPMATAAVTPAGRPPAAEPQLGPRAAFGPSSRVGHFPRAEAFLGRPVPAPQDYGAGLEGARRLFENRSVEAALRALVDVTSVEAGALRVQCLVSLRRYPAAAEEAARVQSLQGDATDFQTRVIAAHLPYLTSSSNAITSLGQLQELASRACGPPVGVGGVGGELEGGEASLKEQLYVLRLVSHVSIAAGYSDVGAREIATAASSADRTAAVAAGQDAAAARRQFHSLLGRHHAAVGNTAAASEAFGLAHEGFPEEGGGVDAWVLLERGLLGVCRGTYALSKPIFEQAAAKAAQAGGAAAAEEILAAENNLAVCRLYTRELRKAIDGLETLVRRDPVAFLTPAVVQNLVSLYEFMSDAVRRRNVVSEMVAAYRLEDIDPKTYEQPGAA